MGSGARYNNVPYGSASPWGGPSSTNSSAHGTVRPPAAYPPALGRGDTYPPTAAPPVSYGAVYNPYGQPSTSTRPAHHAPAFAPPQQGGYAPVPASPPPNMSSLTKFSVRVKDRFRIDPGVPSARLDPVRRSQPTFDSALEDEVLAELDAGGAGADDLIGCLGRADLGSEHGREPACAAAPCVDVLDKTVRQLVASGAGSAAAVRLALARYADDHVRLLKFCASVEEVQGVLGASGAAVVGAHWLSDADPGEWSQNVADMLLV